MERTYDSSNNICQRSTRMERSNRSCIGQAYGLEGTSAQMGQESRPDNNGTDLPFHFPPLEQIITEIERMRGQMNISQHALEKATGIGQARISRMLGSPKNRRIRYQELRKLYTYLRQRQSKLAAYRVADVLTTKADTLEYVTIRSTVASAAETMIEKDFSQIPVLSSSASHCHGFLTELSVVHLLQVHGADQLDSLQLADLLEYLEPAVTLLPSDSLAIAAQHFLNTYAILVVDEQKSPVNVISRFDLLRWALPRSTDRIADETATEA